MPPDQAEIIRRYCTGFPEQNADGVDLSLIRANLRLTPTERVRRMDRARRDALRVLGIDGESSTTRLEDLMEILSEYQVEFIIIGGQAEMLYGNPYVYYDIDLCYQRSPKNLERLAAALGELHVWLRNAPPDVPFIADARSLELGTHFAFESKAGPLDLLVHVEPLGGYEDLLANVETHEMSGREVKVIGLDDLIRVKEHIQRPRDRDSLYQLRAIKEVRGEA